MYLLLSYSGRHVCIHFGQFNGDFDDFSNFRWVKIRSMVQQLLEITTVSWHRDIDVRPEQGKSE